MKNIDLENIKEYTLENDNLKLNFLNYGAIITGIYLKEAGKCGGNLVLSYMDKQSYLDYQGPYLNAVVGPVAGRVAYGKYKYKDKENKLSITSGKHHLHGGESGISKQLFNVVVKGNEAICTLKTNHDEDGFSGTFAYTIIYRLNGSTLEIEFEGIPSEESLCNMMTHTYFNLSGDMDASIRSHILEISSDKRLVIHKDSHPYKMVDIKGNDVFNFCKAKPIADAIESRNEEISLMKGLDTPFILNEDKRIVLFDPFSKNKLEIVTDAPCVVAYSANYFDDSFILNKNKKGYPYCGIALETQDIPNGINLFLNKDDYIYSKDKPYRQKTKYIFSKEG